MFESCIDGVSHQAHLQPMTWVSARILFCSVGLISAACLGGQTGQPTSGSCERVEQPRDAVWKGAKIAELTQAFEGDQRASLHWTAELIGAETQTPVALDDSIGITIHADTDALAQVDCASHLLLPVTVEIETGESGLVDAGPAELRLERAEAPFRGKLSFVGAALQVDAQVAEAAADEAPVGALLPRGETEAPGAQAQFPLPQ